jgi:YNFM family putative membrane transporter
MAHLGEELPGHVRARVMGLYIAANALGGMAGRLLSAVVTDFSGSWQIGLAALGGIGLLVALVFWRLLPPARHFEPRSLQPGLLLADIRRIYADPGLPWLFTTAFLSMGAFVGLYNYLPFRLVQAPTASGRRRSAASSCSTRWAAIPRPGPGARLPATAGRASCSAWRCSRHSASARRWPMRCG